MSKYKAFVFDIGGTLVKTDEALLEAIELALKENGIEMKDRKKVASVFGRSNLINVQTAIETSYTGEDKEEMTKKCFRSFKRVFPGDVISRFRLYPDVIDVLTTLKEKNFKLAIFTGFDRPEATFFLEQMKLSPFFEFAVTVDDVKEPRPNPDALLLAVEKLGVNKEECIYVGDGISDIRMAKNAKMTMVCVKTGVQSNDLLEKERPDFLVNNLSEIFQLFDI